MRRSEPGRPVAVALRPAAGGGGLREVVLAAAGPPDLECRIARAGTEAVAWEVRAEGEPPERGRHREPEPDEATLVGRWLLRLRRDPLHAAALGALPALAPAVARAGGEPVGSPAGPDPPRPDPGAGRAR